MTFAITEALPQPIVTTRVAMATTPTVLLRDADILEAEQVFKLGDARSFSGLTSKIQPSGSLLNFDADVNNATARQQCENHVTQDQERNKDLGTRLPCPTSVHRWSDGRHKRSAICCVTWRLSRDRSVST